MNILSGPVIIALGIWIIYEFHVKRREDNSYFEFYIFTFSIGILSWLLEFIGVHTGFVFGQYQYPGTLLPAIDGVPIAIGFAWIVALLSSRAVSSDIYKGKSKIIITLLTAVFMTVFDVVMEPAAVEMQYWDWYNMPVPMSNYLTWFIVSFVFTAFGEYFDIFEEKIPQMASYFYWAMFLYFLVISLF
jgi:putative membrane protein